MQIMSLSAGVDFKTKIVDVNEKSAKLQLWLVLNLMYTRMVVHYVIL